MLGKRFCAFFVCLFCVLSLILGGCAPAKKPMTPAPPPAKKDITTPAPTKTAPTSTDTKAKAAKIAKAVDKVPEVRKSTVVISGNTAYVGLDLAANVEKGKTNEIEKTVLNKTKAIDPKIKTVLVTSDVDAVTRLKKVYQGILAGKPISSFTRELGEIGRRITPKVKS